MEERQQHGSKNMLLCLIDMAQTNTKALYRKSLTHWFNMGTIMRVFEPLMRLRDLNVMRRNDVILSPKL
jgi:hypothetical protein